MRVRERLRAMLVCATLQIGVIWGVPMRPEQIQALMHAMSQPQLAHVIPEEDEEGDE